MTHTRRPARTLVTVDYGDATPLAHVTCDLGPRPVAVTGPSGSGTSTSLRVLAGEQVPDRGTVTLDGESVKRRGCRRISASRRSIRVTASSPSSVWATTSVSPQCSSSHRPSSSSSPGGTPSAEVHPTEGYDTRAGGDPGVTGRPGCRRAVAAAAFVAGTGILGWVATATGGGDAT
ncbi:ATP-binding cassette domain-containing protein [Mobilicoccus pelagius]|uniref:ATP-binding cassette domain-containing protein n=1 Tax=Mobilicoccus pelagius TaxID=746032 RepID=UPI0002FBB1EC